MSIVGFDGPPSWSLDASETGESVKCLWVEAMGLSLPTGILYSPKFRSYQDTKMAACRNQRSTSMTLRKNEGLHVNSLVAKRTVYAILWLLLQN